VPFRAADPHKIPIDSNGNLTTKTEGSDNWVYTWNAENQLTKVDKNGVEVARFGYDPQGRRVEKVAGGVITSYTYDGLDSLREVRGATSFKYVHGLGVDQPLAREDGSGALAYYHADGLGSIVKHTNQTGVIVHEYRYDAWGNVEAGASEAGSAFTGREWDPEVGLHYYRARYYDSKGANFVSEDPLHLAGGDTNFYAYVRGNPTNWTDPEGQFVMAAPVAWWAGAALVSAVATAMIIQNPPQLPPLPPLTPPASDPPTTTTTQPPRPVPPPPPVTAPIVEVPSRPPHCEIRPPEDCESGLQLCRSVCKSLKSKTKQALCYVGCWTAYIACRTDPRNW
jgi:RHS repeat-associated protein